MDLLSKVRKIEIKTRRLSRNLFTGGYHSAFKGVGMSFSEVRQYQYGDDVRAIDWNVTARTGTPHLKIFEEERELTVMLLVDISGSAFFGTQGVLKQEFLAEICAVLAFSAVSNNDKVGLLLFSDKTDLFVPPGKGRQHILRLIRELVQVKQNDRPTDLAGALQYLRRMLKRRSVCFVLSDFIAPDYAAPLRVLARRHDCVGIHCWDLRERALPDVGLLPLRDAESNAVRWVDTTDPDFRRDFSRQFDLRLARTRAQFREAGAGFLSLQTSEPYVQALLHFFENNRRGGRR